MKPPVNTLNWFEIPVNDFDRARQFYSRLFDYHMQDTLAGPNRRGFLPHDPQGGGVGGAIVQGPDYIPSQRGCLVYLNAGDDLSIVLARVTDAGGKIIQEKTPVSEEQALGYYAIIRDSEGNHIALHSMQ
ncbi:VOC family protein [uncultured Chitinophaga sp.]|jgi:Predicted enzyme related to lactoylglutathione lyase|uniref:VOC family protein n=1 Tax=uncultured Chitinophaga sp. TaxID=339340 RepID=UPI002605498F|nr:VOC family protein [uncultured Chitinophaga sp.]